MRSFLQRFLSLALLAACASAAARQYGQYQTLAPTVAKSPAERLPLHVTVNLAKAANVAVLLVTPGRGTLLLFPDDSTKSAALESGMHTLPTTFAHQDTSRLRREPDRKSVV